MFLTLFPFDVKLPVFPFSFAADWLVYKLALAVQAFWCHKAHKLNLSTFDFFVYNWPKDWHECVIFVCILLCCVCMSAYVSGRLLMVQAGLVVSFSLSRHMNALPRCAGSLSLSPALPQRTVWAPAWQRSPWQPVRRFLCHRWQTSWFLDCSLSDTK